MSRSFSCGFSRLMGFAEPTNSHLAVSFTDNPHDLYVLHTAIIGFWFALDPRLTSASTDSAD